MLWSRLDAVTAGTGCGSTSTSFWLGPEAYRPTWSRTQRIRTPGRSAADRLPSTRPSRIGFLSVAALGEASPRRASGPRRCPPPTPLPADGSRGRPPVRLVGYRQTELPPPRPAPGSGLHLQATVGAGHAKLTGTQRAAFPAKCPVSGPGVYAVLADGTRINAASLGHRVLERIAVLL